MKRTEKQHTVRRLHLVFAVLFCLLSVTAGYIGTLSDRFERQSDSVETLIQKPFARCVRDAEILVQSCMQADREGTEPSSIDLPETLKPENTNFRFTARSDGRLLKSTHPESEPILLQKNDTVVLQTADGRSEATVDYFLCENLQAHDIFYSILHLRTVAHTLYRVANTVAVLCAAASLLFFLLSVFGAVSAARDAQSEDTLLLCVPPDLWVTATLPTVLFALILLFRKYRSDIGLQDLLEAPLAGAGLPIAATCLFLAVLVWLLLTVFSLCRGGLRYTFTVLRYENADISEKTFTAYVCVRAVQCAGLFLLLSALRASDNAALRQTLHGAVGLFGAGDGAYTRFCACGVLLLLLLEKAVTLPMLYRCIRDVRAQMRRTERYVDGDLTAAVDEKAYKIFADHARDVHSIAERISASAGEYIQSNKFKAELITNLSHDIKTPLTAIMSYARLLQKPLLTQEEKMQYLHVLKRHSARMGKLVEDLTDVSDAATGNLKVDLTDVELSALLPQAVQGFEERLQKKNITVCTQFPETATLVRADTRLLWRVVDNLLNNICKYAASDSAVQIIVTGDGDTVTAEFRNRTAFEMQMSGEALMERFVREDTSRHTEGSGLGLSIARSLMQLQNGTLTLQTQATEFSARITLPRSDGEERCPCDARDL